MLCVVESAIVPEMPFDASTITQHRVRRRASAPGSLVSVVFGAIAMALARFNWVETSRVRRLACGSFLSTGVRDGLSCIILDVQMPGMTGPELQARRNADGSEVPIVFSASVHDDAVRARVRGAVAIAFLDKPVDQDDRIRGARRRERFLKVPDSRHARPLQRRLGGLGSVRQMH